MSGEYPNPSAEEQADLISPELRAALAARPHFVEDPERRRSYLDRENEAVDIFVDAYTAMAGEIQRAVDEGQDIGVEYKALEVVQYPAIARRGHRLYVRDPSSGAKIEPPYVAKYCHARDAAFDALLRTSIQTDNFSLLMTIITGVRDSEMAKRFLQELNKNEHDDVFLPFWAAGLSRYDHEKYVAQEFAKRRFIRNLQAATVAYAIKHTGEEAKKQRKNGEIGIVKFVFSSISTALETGVREKVHETFMKPLGELKLLDTVEVQLFRKAQGLQEDA